MRPNIKEMTSLDEGDLEIEAWKSWLAADFPKGSDDSNLTCRITIT